MPADKNENDFHKKWYLPFFVTRTAKPRVVCDCAATAGGVSLNRAVLAGKNLLNDLVDVLIRVWHFWYFYFKLLLPSDFGLQNELTWQKKKKFVEAVHTPHFCLHPPNQPIFDISSSVELETWIFYQKMQNTQVYIQHINILHF